MARSRRKLTENQLNQKYKNRYDYSVKKFKQGKIRQDQILPKPSRATTKFKETIVGSHGQNRGVVGSKGVFMSETDFKKINSLTERNEKRLNRLYKKLDVPYGYFETGGTKAIRVKGKTEIMFGVYKKLDRDLSDIGSQKSVSYLTNYYDKFSDKQQKKSFMQYKENYIYNLIDKFMTDKNNVLDRVENIIKSVEDMTYEEFLGWYLTADEADIDFLYDEMKMMDKLEQLEESVDRHKERLNK